MKDVKTSEFYISPESIQTLNHYGTRDVSELIDKRHKQLKKDNNTLLCHDIDSVRFLARQNLALRGSTQKKDLVDSFGHSWPDNNMWQTLQLVGKYSSVLRDLLKEKKNFSTPDVQNDLLKVTSLMIQRYLATDLQLASWYSIMVYETTDVQNCQQAAFCFRHVLILVFLQFLLFKYAN